MQIAAAVLRGADDRYRLEEVQLADPGPGEVLVRVAGAGMCHTGLLPRVPEFPASPPIISGHEGAGVVESGGPGVDALAPGDHVVLSYDSCRSCRNCLSAHPAYCETFFVRNVVGTGIDADPQVLVPRLVELWCQGRRCSSLRSPRGRRGRDRRRSGARSSRLLTDARRAATQVNAWYMRKPSPTDYAWSHSWGETPATRSNN